MEWWSRNDLGYKNGDMFLGDENLHEFVKSVDTPCFLYNSTRITENIRRLHQVLGSQFSSFQIFYAMKANRNLPLLSHIRALGLTGVDCCSPNEVLLARQVGFQPSQISFTGTAVSNQDLERLLRYSEMRINCDSLSQIRRIGEKVPGRRVGVRINPGSGTGYNASFQYSGDKTTKFGIYADAFPEALQLIRKYHLELEGIHCHLGWGTLTPQLPLVKSALDKIRWFLEECQKHSTIHYVNLGGGLGIPITEDDETLDLEQWVHLSDSYLKPFKVKVFVEPGDYLVKDAGVLLVQVTAVEKKRDKLWVFVDGGSNLLGEPAFYGIPHKIVPVHAPDPALQTIPMSVVGNINEAIDILAESVHLPSNLKEGDFLAILNTGGYAVSMSSNHCMRGQFQEYFL
ncbi:diaminopimelate decarboxylase [Deltaproteobacteria bacterium TL4]